jgi:hypothetical protein
LKISVIKFVSEYQSISFDPTVVFSDLWMDLYISLKTYTMQIDTQVYTPQQLHEANIIVKYLAGLTEQIDTMDYTIIRAFDVSDSVVTESEIQAVVNVKLAGCPIPLSFDIDYLTPSVFTAFLFASDPEESEDRNDARTFFVQNFLTTFLYILYSEAQRVVYSAQAQLN